MTSVQRLANEWLRRQAAAVSFASAVESFLAPLCATFTKGLAEGLTSYGDKEAIKTKIELGPPNGFHCSGTVDFTFTPYDEGEPVSGYLGINGDLSSGSSAPSLTIEGNLLGTILKPMRMPFTSGDFTKTDKQLWAQYGKVVLGNTIAWIEQTVVSRRGR